MSKSKIIRKFERFLFGGIPEQPESTWERDGNPYVEMRNTGRTQSNAANANSDDLELIGTITYNEKEQTAVFQPNPEFNTSDEK